MSHPDFAAIGIDQIILWSPTAAKLFHAAFYSTSPIKGTGSVRRWSPVKSCSVQVPISAENSGIGLLRRNRKPPVHPEKSQ